MIGLGVVYAVAGLMFSAFAILTLRDPANPKRYRRAAFWALLGLSFLAGDRLGDLGDGLLALGLGALAAFGGLGQGRPKTTSAEARIAGANTWGDRLFLLALIIPAITLAGTLGFKALHVGALPLVDPKQSSVIALALGVVVALVVAMLVLRPPPAAPIQEGRRLADMVGWALVLPQMLAALGAVFALAGVGQTVGHLIGAVLPMTSPAAAVIAYTLGMAGFTLVMGNAFAAFPVMTAGVGLPLIVHKFGGDPAIMGALGMLSGFCGTLLTPMAANFNIVPTTLLELPDRWAVIKAQAPTAVLMLIVTTALMYALVFRF
jgi:uncharacterized membrane protein